MAASRHQRRSQAQRDLEVEHSLEIGCWSLDFICANLYPSVAKNPHVGSVPLRLGRVPSVAKKERIEPHRSVALHCSPLRTFEKKIIYFCTGLIKNGTPFGLYRIIYGGYNLISRQNPCTQALGNKNENQSS
jgi:hypothetical protein